MRVRSKYIDRCSCRLIATFHHVIGHNFLLEKIDLSPAEERPLSDVKILFTFAFQQREKGNIHSHISKECLKDDLLEYHNNRLKKQINQTEWESSSMAFAIEPPAILSDLSILSCQRAYVAHLNHGCHKVPEEIFLVAREPVNNGCSGCRRHRVR